jgi:hypothetical protein
MSLSRLKPHQVRQLLRDACKQAGSQQAWAVLHHLSTAYVSEVLRGTREPGPSTLVALGLQRVVLYEAIVPVAPAPISQAVFEDINRRSA